jgi:TfoX/Sxy family transcriptional regulator of competence genes
VTDVRRPGDARRLYDELTDDLLYDPVVGRSTMMGYPCVRRAGRYFASFDTAAEALVLKLPSARVDELIDDGTGEPFAPNGRVFREWVRLPQPDHVVWEQLLAEARDFAAPPAGVAPEEKEELADRIREVLAGLDVDGVREQRMFGGLAFLVGGHMAVAASREGGLLLGVDRSQTAALLAKPHTRPMVMRDREVAGWVRVDAEGVRTKRQLVSLVKRGLDHARALPPKRTGGRR